MLEDKRETLLPALPLSHAPVRRTDKCRPRIWLVVVGLVAAVVAAGLAIAVVLYPGNDVKCPGEDSLSDVAIKSRYLSMPTAWAKAAAQAGVITQDGLIALPLSAPDRYLWVFSDTIINCTVSPTSGCTGWKMISNSAMEVHVDNQRRMTSAQYLLDNTTRIPRQLVPFSSWESPLKAALWPTLAVGPGPSSHPHDNPYMLWWETLQRKPGGGPWAFERWGAGAGALAASNMTVARVGPDVANHTTPAEAVHLSSIPTDLWPSPDASPEDAFVYFVRPADGSQRDLVVAFVPRALLASASHAATLDSEHVFWERETGTWNATLATASPVVHNVGGPSVAVAWLSALNRMVVLSAEPLGSEVLAWDAPSPSGPFRCPVPVFRHTGAEDEWVYGVSLLPGLGSGDGRVVVVSYSRFNTGLKHLLPVMVEVELDLTRRPRWPPHPLPPP